MEQALYTAEELNRMLNNIKNQGHYISDFLSYYGWILSETPELPVQIGEIQLLTYQIPLIKEVTPEFLEYVFSAEAIGNKLHVTPKEECNWLCVMLDYDGSVEYSLTKGESRISGILSPSFTSGRLSYYRLILSPNDNVQNVEVEIPVSTRYALLVPQGTSYEATVYNTDGTIYARFDQTGTIEFYEYDVLGRLLRQTDAFDNVLKSNLYNTLKDEF